LSTYVVNNFCPELSGYLPGNIRHSVSENPYKGAGHTNQNAGAVRQSMPNCVTRRGSADKLAPNVRFFLTNVGAATPALVITPRL
jgi:hypothetical protein